MRVQVLGGDNKDGKKTLVFKDPITDKGKQSKKGALTLQKDAEGKLVTMTEGQGDPSKDILAEVFRDGYLLIDQTCNEIRQRAAIPGCPPAYGDIMPLA